MTLTTPEIPDELLKAIQDFFTTEQLTEYLELTTEDIVEAFPDQLADHLDELTFLMEYHGYGKT